MGLEDLEREATRGQAEKARSAPAIRFTDHRGDNRSRYSVWDDIEKTRKAITKARTTRGLMSADRNDQVLSLVLGSLQKRGEFFHDHVKSYLFLRGERVVLPIDLTEEGLEMVLDDYGLLPNEEITKQVINALRLHGRKKGRATEIHAFAHYDRRSATVYVYDFDGGVYRITAEGIEHVNNGTDDVLFIQKPQWKPLRLNFDSDRSPDWRVWVLSGVTFIPGMLTEQDQRLLFSLWMLTLFFPELFPTRIVLALIGEKGSGKSSLLRRVGQLLFGPKFEVSALTAKQDDFDAAITAEPLVVADNADDAPGWFADKLAVVATGGTIKRRILYTTNRLGDFPILAHVAVTSRTPSFTREDVAERLLPLNIKALEGYTPESALQAETEEQRDAIVSAIVEDVWLALLALESQREQMNQVKFRMADFADFVLRIAPVLSTREEVEGVLTRLGSQQVALASQDEPMFGLIDQWLEDDSEHVNIDRDIALADFGAELERIAGIHPLPWQRGNSKSFGQYFRNRKGTLTRLYGMAAREGHGGTTVVSFHHGPRSDLGDLGYQTSPPSLSIEDER